MSTKFDIYAVAQAIIEHDLDKVKELTKHNELHDVELYVKTSSTPLFEYEDPEDGPIKDLTLLDLAVVVGDLDIVKYLCEVANDKWYDGIEGHNFTPLHTAMVYNRWNIAEYLATCRFLSPFTITNYAPHDSPFTMALDYKNEYLIIHFLKILKKQIPKEYIDKVFKDDDE